MNNLNKEFYYKGNAIGIILIHGFTSIPEQMKNLGIYLSEKGYTVKGVLLKGHGTTPKDLESTNYKDWIKSVEVEYTKMREKCKQLIVIGESMGGLIALNIASRFDVDSIVSIATPMRLKDKKIYFFGLLKHFKKNVPSILSDNLCYNVIPLRSIQELIKLLIVTKLRIKKVNNPILIMQSVNDKFISEDSAKYIYEKSKSKYKKIVYFSNSGHCITLGAESDKLNREILNFIKEMVDING